MFEMRHYVSKDKDGNIHVQNAVGGFMGQHHVHTPEDFTKWANGHVRRCDLVHLNGICDCGMQPGECNEGGPKRG